MDLSNLTAAGNENAIKLSSYSTQIWNLISVPSQLASRSHDDTPWKSKVQQQQQLQQNGKGRRHHRTLPLIAQWTIACDDLRSMSGSPLNPIPQQLEDQIMNIIQLSNGRSFPFPLWIWKTLRWDLSETIRMEELWKIMEYDIKFSTALIFYSCSRHIPIYRRIAAALLRYTCPFFSEGGPILAYQRGRRLPDRSLITLVALEEYNDRDVWNSKWKDGSILPQRAISIDHRSGETHVIGILHRQLHYATTSQFRPEQHLQLVSVLIPHCGCCYLNTPMIFGQEDSLKLTPMEIVTFQGHQQLMEQLLSFGAEPLSSSNMHPNEVKLRQLLQSQSSVCNELPYKRLTDFEIDWKSDDIIRQGKHSRVYKASPKWIDKGTKYLYESCAVKIIPLTTSTTLFKVAREIMIIDRWNFIGSNQLIGLEATAEYVAMTTPFAKDGTLEDYLPTLLKQKHDIINNNNENDIFPLAQRHIKYLHHICPIVCGLFNRLIHQHKEHILHRDLRLSNIVLNSVSKIYPEYVNIIDYGHATQTYSSGLDEDKQRIEDPYFYCECT
jgi:hypothetical protein